MGTSGFRSNTLLSREGCVPGPRRFCHEVCVGDAARRALALSVVGTARTGIAWRLIFNGGTQDPGNAHCNPPALQVTY